MVAEEKYQGKVTWRTYLSYMQAAGGVLVVMFVILIYILSVGVQSGSSWWLSYWLKQGGGVSCNDLISWEKGTGYVVKIWLAKTKKN